MDRFAQHTNLTSDVPIVLVSGATMLVQDWGDLPDKLAHKASQQVITYDPRGFGASTLSPEGAEKISLETYAEDLVALLQTLAAPQADLLGWSMGAWVIGTLLATPGTALSPSKGFEVQPSLVIRQALLACACIKKTEHGPPPDMGDSAADRAHLDLTLNPAEQWKKMSHSLVRPLYPSGWPEQSASNKAQYDAMVHSYISTPQRRPLAVLRKQSAFIMPGGVDIGPGLLGLSPQAQARIGILTCPHDLIMSPTESEAMYAALPFARAIRLPLSTGGVVGHIFWNAGSIDDWAYTLADFFRQGEQLAPRNQSQNM